VHVHLIAIYLTFSISDSNPGRAGPDKSFLPRPSIATLCYPVLGLLGSRKTCNDMRLLGVVSRAVARDPGTYLCMIVAMRASLSSFFP
jgi:hypothetical protein